MAHQRQKAFFHLTHRSSSQGSTTNTTSRSDAQSFGNNAQRILQGEPLSQTTTQQVQARLANANGMADEEQTSGPTASDSSNRLGQAGAQWRFLLKMASEVQTQEDMNSIVGHLMERPEQIPVHLLPSENKSARFGKVSSEGAHDAYLATMDMLSQKHTSVDHFLATAPLSSLWLANPDSAALDRQIARFSNMESALTGSPVQSEPRSPTGFDEPPNQNNEQASSTKSPSPVLKEKASWKTWKASGRPRCTTPLRTGRICGGRHPAHLHDARREKQPSRRDRSVQGHVRSTTASSSTEQAARMGQMLAAVQRGEVEMSDFARHLDYPDEYPWPANRSRDNRSRSPAQQGIRRRRSPSPAQRRNRGGRVPE